MTQKGQKEDETHPQSAFFQSFFDMFAKEQYPEEESLELYETLDDEYAKLTAAQQQHRETATEENKEGLWWAMRS